MKKNLFALFAIAAMTLCSCGENQKEKSSGDDGNFDSVVVDVKFLTEVTITDMYGETKTYTTDLNALDVEYFYGFKEDGSDAKYVKINQQNPSDQINIPVTSSTATLYGGIKYTLKPDYDKTKKVGLGRSVVVDSYKCYKSGSLVENPKGSIRPSSVSTTGSNYDLNDEEDLKHFNSFIERSKSPRIICTVSK